MNKVFVDASVLMEVLLARANRQACEALLADEGSVFFVSSLTVHLAYHFCEKYKVAVGPLEDLLESFTILPIDANMVKQAQRRYTSKDFEDCLQAAAAEAGTCQEIATLDKKFATRSSTKLPVRIAA
jgi:predicted nucleic acid-binding protein